MESIPGKISAVTGGTRGIGRAIVERLLHEGAAVASCGQTKRAVECASSELRGKGRTFGCASDVSRPEGARVLSSRGQRRGAKLEFGAEIHFGDCGTDELIRI